MKVFSFMVAALAGMLIFCGCSKNSLKYVPEDAEVVAYGNIEAFLDSKIGELLVESDTFNDEFFKEVKKMLKVEEADDLSGNFAVWWNNIKRSPEPNGAVISFDDGIAEEIFNAMLKQAKNNEYRDVSKDELKDHEMFVVRYQGSKRVEYSVVLINKYSLQLNWGEEADKVLEADGDNEIADKIDKSAVAAFGASPDVFENVCKMLKKETKIDISGIGFGIVELFVDGDKIEIKSRLEIDDLEID